MKLFGEYLVEKQIVSEELLAKALVEQIKHLPSTTEVIFEQKIMSNAQFLSVLRRQNEKKTGFIEAAIELSLWSPEISSKIEAILAKKRKPLGQVLVGLGAASLKDITHALDDFLSDVPAPVVAPESIIEPAVEPMVEPAVAEPVSMPLDVGFDSFCELFTIELRAQLENPTKTESLKFASTEIHRLKGAARLFRAPQMELLLTGMEEMLEEVARVRIEQLNPSLAKKFYSVYQSAIQFLWETQSELKVAGSEENIFSNETQKTALNELVSAIQLFKFDLSLS